MVEMTAPNGATVVVDEAAAEKLVKYGYSVKKEKPKAAPRTRATKAKE